MFPNRSRIPWMRIFAIRSEIILRRERHLLAEWWAGGIAPMLIVQGLDDKVAPPENDRRMLEEFGDRITLIEIEEAGHVMGLERALETANAIVDFLV